VISNWSGTLSKTPSVARSMTSPSSTWKFDVSADSGLKYHYYDTRIQINLEQLFSNIFCSWYTCFFLHYSTIRTENYNVHKAYTYYCTVTYCWKTSDYHKA
jgi:hypothetical protein